MKALLLRGRRGVWLPAIVAFLASLLPMVAAHAARGTITGTVSDAANGDPLEQANVLVVESDGLGATTNERGEFTISFVPPGSYTVRVIYLGYEERTLPVTVNPDEEVDLDFTLNATIVELDLGVVEVSGRRTQIDLKETQVKTSVTGDDIASLPVDELTDAIALKAGVVARGDELYFRGGRSGEVSIMVDGMAVKNPLSGGSVELGSFAVEDAEVILGGMDAKYGNAQSGVINYSTKEGGDHVAGAIRYETDDFGAPDKTFNNYDRVQFNIGGPLPIRNANYFFSAQGSWSDSYPATRERRNHTRVLDFISVGDRKVNDIRVQSKVTWKPGIPYKLALEYINNRTHSDIYRHNWSWTGYVRTFLDTVETGEGQVVEERSGPWSPFQVDDSYEYYNAFEHTPNNENRFNQVKLAFTHTMGEGNTFYTVKVGRNAFRDDSKVGSKNPWAYEGDLRRDLYFDYENSAQSNFYVRNGDYPLWSERDTKVYTTKVDGTHRWNAHTIEGGFDVRYNDLFFHQVTEPYVGRSSQSAFSSGEIGFVDRYHYFQAEWAAYVQDRWEHEGMVLNLGMRYDAFDVGQQLDPSLIQGGRVKQQISPRVGIAYPISDRDVFSFHYGRYYQFPDRRYLYENYTGTAPGPSGNPNLTNENTVAYQAAIQHLFSAAVKGQFSVYYKDIFGLLSVQQVRASDRAALQDQYLNRDYASSRGFEVSLIRQFAGGFTGELAYSFGVASGVASDPDAANALSFRYLPISEQPLDWDQRHTFKAQFTVSDPTGLWSLGGVWSFGTGFPYTPRERDTRDLEPEVVNSRRLPSDNTFDLQAERHYRIWGQPFKVFVQARNVLDTRNVVSLGPANWPLSSTEIQYDYEVYYTETGNAGGAYLGEDIDGDGSEDWIPLNDPRVLADGRVVRLGVQLTF